VNNPCTLCEDW